MPLNTARTSTHAHSCSLTDLVFFFSLVLAVQNMEASGTVAKEQEIEFSALKGSLSMMSKGKFILSYKIIIY